ncbi:hypothetical protein GCM10023063_49700 [Arthrobacter methylotrophus]|uniref:hypothetical protein n=1 Tax=Arthrobacter methylotrophus TaxID=121291 RepID=UPI0031EECE89
MRPITIGRDYGRTVEIVSGLKAGDALILNRPTRSNRGGGDRRRAQAGVRTGGFCAARIMTRSATFGTPALVAALVASLAGCSLAPTYERPAMDIPAHWQTEAPWRPAQPPTTRPRALGGSASTIRSSTG